MINMKSKTPWLYRPQVKGRLPKPFAPWLSKRKISPAEMLRQRERISEILVQDPLYRAAYRHYRRFHDALDRELLQNDKTHSSRLLKLSKDKKIRLALQVVPLMQQGNLRNYIALYAAKRLMAEKEFQKFSKRPEFAEYSKTAKF